MNQHQIFRKYCFHSWYNVIVSNGLTCRGGRKQPLMTSCAFVLNSWHRLYYLSWRKMCWVCHISTFHCGSLPANGWVLKSFYSPPIFSSCFQKRNLQRLVAGYLEIIFTKRFTINSWQIQCLSFPNCYVNSHLEMFQWRIIPMKRADWTRVLVQKEVNSQV